jgi:uncharacterized repeat protein (TIGR04138 family)
MTEINPYESPRLPSTSESDPDPRYAIACLASEGTPYPPEAFLFLVEGLRFAERHIRHQRKRAGSVDAVDLSWCLHDLAVYRFAESARAKLASWNIRQTQDFGHLVYRMVELGQMRTEDGDAIGDFADVFDFATEFNTSQFEATLLIEEDTE